MLLRRICAAATCLVTGVCGIGERIDSRRAERAEPAAIETTFTAPAPVTPTDDPEVKFKRQPIVAVSPAQWEQVKVCDGNSCHMEWRKKPVTRAAAKVGKVAAKAASCGCGHPDCNCGENCDCPDCPGNTRSQKVTSQPANTTTTRTYRSGPVRRLFGGRR